MSFVVKCLDCGHAAPYFPTSTNCPRCNSQWREAEYDYETLAKTLPLQLSDRPFDLWRYRELLPVRNSNPGLTLGDAKQGWELLRGRDELIEVNVEGLTLWSSAAKAKPLSRSTRSSSAVRLLPAFDTYLWGYSDRDHVVPPKYQHQVYHGGQVVPVVLVDGAAAGVWRYERKGKRLNITVRPFESFSRSVQQLIAEEAEDVGRFFDSPVALSYSQRGW